MPHYIYSDNLLPAVHRAMWRPLLLTLDIGGGRGKACKREEVLTSVLQKRRLMNEFELQFLRYTNAIILHLTQEQIVGHPYISNQVK